MEDTAPECQLNPLYAIPEDHLLNLFHEALESGRLSEEFIRSLIKELMRAL